MLQEMNRRLITLEAFVKPEEHTEDTLSSDFHRVLERTHGAWSAHPWTNHLTDVRAMREEWNDHDP
jgi:hypothetical protein